MNMNSLINMIVRQLMRRGVNSGIRAGINAVSKRRTTGRHNDQTKDAPDLNGDVKRRAKQMRLARRWPWQ